MPIVRTSRHAVEELDAGTGEVRTWYATLALDLPRRVGTVQFSQLSWAARSHTRHLGRLTCDGLTLNPTSGDRTRRLLFPHAHALVADTETFLDLVAQTRERATRDGFAPGIATAALPSFARQLACLEAMYRISDRTVRQAAFALITAGYDGPADELREVVAAATAAACTTGSDRPADLAAPHAVASSGRS